MCYYYVFTLFAYYDYSVISTLLVLLFVLFMDKGAEHTNPKRVPRRRSTEIESQSEAPNQIGGQGDELEGKPNDRKIRYTTHIYIYIYINIYIYIYISTYIYIYIHICSIEK